MTADVASLRSDLRRGLRLSIPFAAIHCLHRNLQMSRPDPLRIDTVPVMTTLLILPARVRSVNFYPPSSKIDRQTLIEWVIKRLRGSKHSARMIVGSPAQSFQDEECDEIITALGAIPFHSHRLGDLNFIREAAEFTGSDHITVANLETAFGPLSLIDRTYREHLNAENDYTTLLNAPENVGPTIYSARILDTLLESSGRTLPTDPSILLRLLSAKYRAEGREGEISSMSTSCDFSAMYSYEDGSLPRTVSLRSYTEVLIGIETIISVCSDSYEPSTCQLLQEWKRIELRRYNQSVLKRKRSEISRTSIHQRCHNIRSSGDLKVLLATSAAAFGGPHAALTSALKVMETSEMSVSALIGYSGHFSKLLTSYGIQCTCVEASFAGISMDAFDAVLSTLRRIAPDIIHVDGVDCRLIYLAAYSLNIPVIQHVRIANCKAYGGFLSAASRLISVSQFVDKELTLYGIDSSFIHTIYDGVSLRPHIDHSVLESYKGEYLGIPSDHRIILQVGRIEPGKRQDHGIHALAILRKNIPNIHLVIVGELQRELGYYNHIMDLVEQLGVEEFVSFVPFQHDMDMLYGAADILINCGVREALGLAVLEAMASRVPVVVSGSGGHLEIVEPNVSGLIASDAPESIASRIARVLDDEVLRLNLVRNGLVQIKDRFSASVSASRLVAVYDMYR